MKSTKPLPLAVRRVLRDIGRNLRAARLARRLPLDIVAERAMTSRQTLARVERGDAGDGFGIYLAALHALGLLETARALAAPSGDPEGTGLALEQLPERAFLPGTRVAGSPTAKARARRRPAPSG